MDRRARQRRHRLLHGLLPALLAAAAWADEAPIADTLGPAFATRNAAFLPVSYARLPGWDSDALHESANGMRASCRALQRKPVWTGICADFDALDGSDAALRGFFLRNFYAYQIMSPARQPDGLITGYFEPLLDGRRQRDERFRHPVYGMPRDLLTLDASARGQGASAWLTRQGNRLLPAEPGAPGAAQYTLALDDARPNIRDKRLRVRLDGNIVRPYWTRQEIEQQALDAPVLAWVDDARRLYSLQIQGSGKIELEDGSLIRVSYLEQNGQPFLPNVTRSTDAGLVLQAIKTRGLRVGAASGALAPDPAVPAVLEHAPAAAVSPVVPVAVAVAAVVPAVVPQVPSARAAARASSASRGGRSGKSSRCGVLRSSVASTSPAVTERSSACAAAHRSRTSPTRSRR